MARRVPSVSEAIEDELEAGGIHLGENRVPMSNVLVWRDPDTGEVVVERRLANPRRPE